VLVRKNESDPFRVFLYSSAASRFAQAALNVEPWLIQASAAAPLGWEEFQLTPVVQFDVQAAGIFLREKLMPASNAEILYTAELVNDSKDSSLTQQFSQTITKTDTFQWSLSQTLMVGFKASLTWDVMDVAKAVAEVSASLTLSANETWTTTTTKSYTFVTTVDIPPGSAQQVICERDTSEDQTQPIEVRAWVSGRYENGGNLTAEEIVDSLKIQRGFTGRVIMTDIEGDPKTGKQKVLVGLAGTVTGAFTIAERVHVEPLER
jgi:hypothetical protein